MSHEDSELERLKAKRLAEMQRNISAKQNIEHSLESGKQSPPPFKDPRATLVKTLGFRGLEVLENAESQFPNAVRGIVKQLSEFIESGEINEVIDGGKLLTLFRTVGLNVRMETKIHIEQDGKFISLSDKLNSSKSSDNSDDK